MNFYKGELFWLLVFFLIINILGCKRGAFDELSRFFPSDASRLIAIQDLQGQESVVPAFVRRWEFFFGKGPFLMANCPVGNGMWEWLCAAPAGAASGPSTFLNHPKIKLIRHWTYLGAKIYVLDAGPAGRVTFAFAGSVVLCSPRTLLVEEALERKSGRSSFWEAPFKYLGVEGAALIWHSRYSADMMPLAKGVKGFLEAPYQYSRDTAWISFRFTPQNKMNHSRLQPFPFALSRLVPEDALVFDWPVAPVLEEETSVVWNRFFAPWAIPDHGLVRLPGQDSSCLAILEAAVSPKIVSEYLKSYASHFGILKSYEYQSFPIVQAMDHSIPELLAMTSKRPVCFLELDGYVLLSDNPEVLEQWVDFYRIGAMLDKKLGADHPALAEKAVSWRYLSPFQPAPGWLSSWIPGFPAALSWLGKSDDEWSWNVAPAGRSGAYPQLKGNILWRKTFPRSIQRFFPLPGAPVAAVQDESNQLYFLDQFTGAVIWSKKLDGFLLSDIFSVNIPSLNERGWLMNTRSAVYLFSESGGLFAGYPLRLRAFASAGLTFFPGPEGQGDAYFFPSENRRIYGYSLDGTPLNAWSPGPETGDITAPLICFPFADKDYIAGYSFQRGLFAMDPLGNTHFNPVKVPMEGIPAPVADPASPNPRFIVFDGKGRAHVINLQGAQFPLRITNNPGWPTQSLFADFTGDARKDFLSVQGSQLQLCGYEGNIFKVFWTQRLETPADTLMLVDKPGKKWAALGRRKSRTLTLLDGNGREVAGSPVGGSQGLKWTASGLVISVLDDQVVGYQLPKPQFHRNKSVE